MNPFEKRDQINPGVYRIALPTPFHVGRINVYFIEGDRPILVDAGLDSKKSHAALVEGLATLGRTIEDIHTILITHPHIDHMGQAARLVEESGAQLYCPTGARRILENYYSEWKTNGEYMRQAFPKMGLAEAAVEFMLESSKPLKRFIREVKVDGEFVTGDMFSTGQLTVSALATPGHTPYCTTLIDTQNRFALTGDFLIRHITSNPVHQRPRDQTSAPSRPLVQLLQSLDTFSQMEPGLVLPGHGGAIDDHRSVIANIHRHHKRRTDRIRDALASSGPLTPMGVVETIFPRLKATDIFLAVSEVLGHLERLEAEGTARREETDDALLFHSVTSDD